MQFTSVPYLIWVPSALQVQKDIGYTTSYPSTEALRIFHVETKEKHTDKKRATSV